MRALRAGISAVFAGLSVACGGGVDVRLFVSFNAPPAVTSGSIVILSGVAALPDGSVRSGGTLFQPIVTCQPGTFSMTWTNDANGARGAVFALWDCPADRLTWSTEAIPLARGGNRITVTIVDALGSASSAVDVRRE